MEQLDGNNILTTATADVGIIMDGRAKRGSRVVVRLISRRMVILIMTAVVISLKRGRRQPIEPLIVMLLLIMVLTVVEVEFIYFPFVENCKILM